MKVTLGHFASRLNERVLTDVVAVRAQRSATLFEFKDGRTSEAIFWGDNLDADDIPLTYESVTYDTLVVTED